MSPEVETQREFQLTVPSLGKANDDELITRLVHLINKTFGSDENGLWIKEHMRTDEEEVNEMLQEGMMAVAWRPDALQVEDRHDTAAIIGCIKVEHRGQAVELGMLVCEHAYRGAGVGRALMDWAEAYILDHGLHIAEVELWEAVDVPNPHKELLNAWYTRMGYRFVKESDVATDYPHLASHLLFPARIKLLRKNLTGEAGTQ